MRREAIARKLVGEAGKAARFRGHPSDGDVGGVARGPLLPESEDHIRLEATYDAYRFSYECFRVDVLKRAISVVQTRHVLDAQRLAGRAKLSVPDFGQCAARRGLCIPYLARTASGERRDHRFGAGVHIFGKRPTGAKGLVVGVGEDAK